MKQLQAPKPQLQNVILSIGTPTWDDDVRTDRLPIGLGAYRLRRLPSLDEQELELSPLD